MPEEREHDGNGGQSQPLDAGLFGCLQEDGQQQVLPANSQDNPTQDVSTEEILDITTGSDSFEDPDLGVPTDQHETREDGELEEEEEGSADTHQANDRSNANPVAYPQKERDIARRHRSEEKRSSQARSRSNRDHRKRTARSGSGERHRNEHNRCRTVQNAATQVEPQAASKPAYLRMKQSVKARIGRMWSTFVLGCHVVIKGEGRSGNACITEVKFSVDIFVPPDRFRPADICVPGARISCVGRGSNTTLETTIKRTHVPWAEHGSRFPEDRMCSSVDVTRQFTVDEVDKQAPPLRFKATYDLRVRRGGDPLEFVEGKLFLENMPNDGSFYNFNLGADFKCCFHIGGDRLAANVVDV